MARAGGRDTRRAGPPAAVILVALFASILTFGIDQSVPTGSGLAAVAPVIQLMIAALSVTIGIVAVSRSRVFGTPAYMWLGLGIGGFGVINGELAMNPWLANAGLVASPAAASQLCAHEVAELLLAGFLVLAAYNPIPRFSPTRARLLAAAAVVLAVMVGAANPSTPGWLPVTLDSGVTGLTLMALAGVTMDAEWRGSPLRPFLILSLCADLVGQLPVLGTARLQVAAGLSVADLAVIIAVAALVIGGANDLRMTFIDVVASRRQLESAYGELVARTAEAERANRVRLDFLGLVGHELRTPLNHIIGFTQLLGARPSPDPKAMQYLHNIEKSGSHLMSLVDDILTMTAEKSGRPTAMSPIDAAGIVGEAVTKAAADSLARGVSLKSLVEPGWALGDERMLARAADHLLDNAVKFTSAQGSVSVQARPEGSDYVIAFSDEGPGITDGDLGNIFEPFVQLDAGTRRIHQGLGLGLAVTRELVSTMAGRVTVACPEEGGTTFTITLPGLPTPRAAVQLKPAP
jgi:signal transduction histidine kinase